MISGSFGSPYSMLLYSEIGGEGGGIADLQEVDLTLYLSIPAVALNAVFLDDRKNRVHCISLNDPG